MYIPSRCSLPTCLSPDVLDCMPWGIAGIGGRGGVLASAFVFIVMDQDIIDWFVQITLAVEFIHSRRILHRDLKTSNDPCAGVRAVTQWSHGGEGRRGSTRGDEGDEEKSRERGGGGKSLLMCNRESARC